MQFYHATTFIYEEEKKSIISKINFLFYLMYLNQGGGKALYF